MNEERRIAELEEQVEKLSKDNKQLFEYTNQLLKQFKDLENQISRLYSEQFKSMISNSNESEFYDTPFKNK